MGSESLSVEALALAEESGSKLRRWLLLFEGRLAAAEARGEPCDLKDFAVFTAALERLLKIAKLAQGNRRGEEETTHGGALDVDALRALLVEED